jgi:hypothetical protein
MKKVNLLLAGLVGALLIAVAAPAVAADAGKEKTITGEAKCGKCALKETEKCQTVIQTKDTSGKTVTYYLTDNATAKDFHKNVCSETKKVTATGTEKKVEGKTQFTASKIDIVK